MKIKFIFSLSVISALILSSCGTSNEVAGGGFLQKRKYTKGFYLNRGVHLNESASNDERQIEESEAEVVYSAQKESAPMNNGNVVSEDKVNNTVSHSNEDATLDSDRLMNGEVSEERGSSSAADTQTTEDASATQSSEVRSDVKTKKNTPNVPGGDVNTILLVILALIIPPLAVFLYEGATGRFWIDLILALLGWGVGFVLLPGLWWICGLVAVIYALLIVLGVI